MKAKELLEALALPLEIAGRKISTSPIVTHVRLAEGKAAAYNFAAGVELALPDLKLECCVPGARFAAALNAIATLAGGADVKLSTKNSTLTITAPGVRYSIPTLPVADFPMPPWPTEEKTIGDWKTLVSAMKFAVHPCTRSDVRPFCHGVAAKEGYIGGTDGHRGAIARNESQLEHGQRELIVPLEAVPAIASLPPATSFAVSDTALAFHFEGGRYIVQQIDGGYPDLSRVVPPKHDGPTAQIERAALLAAANAILKTRSRDFVRFTLEAGKFALEDEAPGGDGGARVEVQCVYDGPRWDDGINVQYIAQAVDALDGEHITASFNANRQLLMKGAKESRSVVIMAAKL